MKFKIGDSFKHFTFKDEEIEIINILNDRCLIKYLNVFNVSGTNKKTWVHNTNIEIDKKFYRDQKLNQILNEPN